MNPESLSVGAALPEWSIAAVSPDAMRVTSAICRDPNPIHWDRDAAEAAGFGHRVVNQGPLNLAYVANMLAAWAGPTALRRLTARFVALVQEGDGVTAGGIITAIDPDPDPAIDHDPGIDAGSRLAHCDVWLDRHDGVRAVTGTAVVVIPADPLRRSGA